MLCCVSVQWHARCLTLHFHSQKYQMTKPNIEQELSELQPKKKAAQVREFMPLIEQKLAAGVSMDDIISVLAKCGVDSAAQLCKDLSYDAGAMTRMIDRLEAKGLVNRRRCPEDRRVIYVAVREPGTKLLAELDKPVLQLNKRLLGHLSEMELKELTRLLEKARAGLEEEP